MAFKENLLQKIRVDQLAAQVLTSIGAEGTEARLPSSAALEVRILSAKYFGV